MNVTLSQIPSHPALQDLDAQPHWIVLLPSPEKAPWEAIPYGEVLKRRHAAFPSSQRKEQVIATELPNVLGTRVCFACVKPATDRLETGCFETLTLARKLAAKALAFEPKAVALWVSGFEDTTREKLAEALIAALLAASVDMPSYKSRPNEQTRLTRIDLYGLVVQHAFARTFAEAEGNNLARYLTCLPANELTPGSYRDCIKRLAAENDWPMEFLDIQALTQKRAGAFLAVAQGSPEQDAGIVRLVYTPSGRAPKEKLALVGKGICFDTGGINVKPAKMMRGMHKDMQGSAVALGTFLALTRLKVDFQMECWLALATNYVGPHAYKPNDVVTAANGATIEVIDTDAEGRMVLADALALASADKPSLIIDYATLTGTCKRALGQAYSGAFTNRRLFLQILIETGYESGERVWPFPLDEDYDEALESAIADIKQCAEEGEADHILAARFLKRFVNDIPWIHLDLSSGTHKGGLGHVPTDVTGFGVRFTVSLLLDKHLLG